MYIWFCNWIKKITIFYSSWKLREQHGRFEEDRIVVAADRGRHFRPNDFPIRPSGQQRHVSPDQRLYDKSHSFRSSAPITHCLQQKYVKIYPTDNFGIENLQILQ